MLREEQLKRVLEWAGSSYDKEGRSLLERARLYMLEHPDLDKYRTEVEISDEVNEKGENIIEHTCSCPHARKGNVCKHVVAKILLMHREYLESKSGKWREFFREYDRRVEEVMEEVLKDFGNF